MAVGSSQQSAPAQGYNCGVLYLRKPLDCLVQPLCRGRGIGGNDWCARRKTLDSCETVTNYRPRLLYKKGATLSLTSSCLSDRLIVDHVMVNGKVHPWLSYYSSFSNSAVTASSFAARSTCETSMASTGLIGHFTCYASICECFKHCSCTREDQQDVLLHFTMIQRWMEKLEIGCGSI